MADVVKCVKKFFKKEFYNFNRTDISLYNFHPQLFMLNAILGIFFKNRNSRLRFIWPMFSIFMTIVALTLQSMVVYKGLTLDDDNSLAIECFCYVIMLAVVPPTFFGFLKNNKAIIGLLTDMNEDFLYVSRLSPLYRGTFLNGQLLIWKYCLSWLLFCGAVVGVFMFYPVVMLVYQALFVTSEVPVEAVDRPLVFPIWMPHDDAYRTPYYEVFVAFEMTYCFVYLQSFCGYVYILFHYLLHNNIIMDLIILDFGVIFEGLDESVVKLPTIDPRRIRTKTILQKRIERIVTWHNSVFKALATISSVFGPPLVYQLMLSAFAICVMAYQIATKMDEGKFNYLFMLLFIAGVLQVWIPCYLGTILRNKGFAVAEACWNCGWHETKLGQMIKTDIIFILMRAQKPIYIRFPGLANVELEAFSSIMSTSYSYFNMLRQNQ